MRHRRPWLALACISVVCACTSERDPQSTQQTIPTTPATPAAATPVDPAVRSDYGVVPGRRDFSDNSPEHFIREAGYPRGVFAVSMPERPQLLAFDADSNAAAICTRIDPKTFELPNSNIKYGRFRCPDTWTSREVVFLDATEFVPKYAEQLEWTALAGPSPLPMPGATPANDLHDYAAIARPGLLNGQLLVSAAWFAGEYLPRKERDELRGDTIAFGHYQLLDRTLFIGDSLQKPSTILYQAKDAIEVREGIEWAFLPQNASEKTSATISTLYEVPSGYLVRVSMHHDHEGFGEDLSTYFYAWEKGQWRLLAKAEYTRLY